MSETVRVRALVYDDRTGAAPSVVDVVVVAPQAGEVRVRMRAAGVCHSDLHAVNGDWPSGQRVVLGHEGAGVVDAIGDGVENVRVGDHVAVNWYAPCGACASCRRERTWLCTETSALVNALPGGVTRTIDAATGEEVWPYLGVGLFAEVAIVPAHAVIPLPADVPFDVAALIGCSVTTGVGAVANTARVVAGETAVVVGCGGVGQSIIMALKAAGAQRIVAVDRSAAQLERARALGATHTVPADGGEHVAAAVILGDGADVVFDAIGHPAVSASLTGYLAPGGRAVIVGMPSMDGTAPMNTWDIVTRGLTVLGCNYGSAVPERDFPLIAARYLSGELPIDALIGEHVPLAAAATAIARLAAGGSGRTIVEFSG